MFVEDFTKTKKSSKTPARRYVAPKPKRVSKPKITKRTDRNVRKPTTAKKNANPAEMRSRTGSPQKHVVKPATNPNPRITKVGQVGNPAEQRSKTGGTTTSRAVKYTGTRKPTAVTPVQKVIQAQREQPSVIVEPSQTRADRGTYNKGRSRSSYADTGYFPHVADAGSMLVSPNGKQTHHDPNDPELQKATKVLTLDGKVIGTSVTDYRNRNTIMDAVRGDQAARDFWAMIDASSLSPSGAVQTETGAWVPDTTHIAQDPTKSAGALFRGGGGAVGALGAIASAGGGALGGGFGNPLAQYLRAGYVTPEVAMLLRRMFPNMSENELVGHGYR